MTPTDLESVRALAGLARLALSEEQLARLAPELERILAAFQVLARHPGGGPPAAEPVGAARAREDQPLPSLKPAELLASAPAREEDFFSVPKTIGAER